MPGRKKTDKLTLYKGYENRIKARNEKPMNMNDWEKKHRPTGETKQEKFVRLAKIRMNKVLHALDTIKNLSGNGYESTPEQTKKMIDTLKSKVSEIETSFSKTKKDSEKFTL